MNPGSADRQEKHGAQNRTTPAYFRHGLRFLWNREKSGSSPFPPGSFVEALKDLVAATQTINDCFANQTNPQKENPMKPTSTAGEGTLTSHPPIVSRDEWRRARDQLLVKEKAATRAGDALAAERRRLPMVRIEKDYVFDGPHGKVRLPDLFEGRRQLIIYHFMFAPGVDGWPSAGCPGCSMVVDYLGPLAHLHARDTSLALVSLAPLINLESYKRRMGWDVPWFSSEGTDFNKDFGLTTPQGETFGLSTFLRMGDEVFHTYFTTDRALEAVDTNFILLDWTALGRQENWEDSPEGWPQSETLYLVEPSRRVLRTPTIKLMPC